jgi:ABC-type glutathione transport system ATPase component
MSGEALLRVADLSCAYESRLFGGLGSRVSRQVLKGINLTINEGEIFGLVGESGSGKSTLARCILGLLDYQGSVRINGIEASSFKRRRLERALQVQAVFQDPAGALNPAKTVEGLLEEPLKIHHMGDATERRARVEEALAMVGLDQSYRSRRPDELSGGQKQRVCIAASLLLKPRLIIADEAVSSLDVSVGAQILNLFQDLHRKLKLSMLFISHNLNLVYYLCDRIAVIHEGTIVECGSAEEIYTNPRHPYTKSLLQKE